MKHSTIKRRLLLAACALLASGGTLALAILVPLATHGGLT
jgi:hypothetical protein